MSATKPATAFELWLAKPTAETRDAAMVAPRLAHVTALRLAPLLCPSQPSVGTSIELDIVLVSKPLGLGNVVVATMAHVCRAEAAAMPDWYGIAATFDDVQFGRDDHIPSRYLQP